jgi:polyhydroxyalkanoate synthesis regulator phasin
MPSKGKKSDDSGFVGGLAERGEKAVNRVMDELARNPRVTDALDKAMSAKGRVDSSARRTLSQLGLAAADELKDLRTQIERLERRLARVEDTTGTKPASTAKRSETKKAPSAKKTTTATTTKKSAPKKKPSPSAGRSLGGGTGRGSSAGSGSSTS